MPPPGLPGMMPGLPLGTPQGLLQGMPTGMPLPGVPSMPTGMPMPPGLFTLPNMGRNEKSDTSSDASSSDNDEGADQSEATKKDEAKVWSLKVLIEEDETGN